jgi:hypothetical protein
MISSLIFLEISTTDPTHVSRFYPGSVSSLRKNRNREPLGGKEETMPPVGSFLGIEKLVNMGSK